jgi:hypothetical protein
MLKFIGDREGRSQATDTPYKSNACMTPYSCHPSFGGNLKNFGGVTGNRANNKSGAVAPERRDSPAFSL